MGAKAGGCYLNVSINNFRLGVADLVTVGTQVACAAIEGTVGILHLHRLFIARQGEIGLCVGGVDVMAGSAVER
jgi:hypothetical protein